MPNKNIKIELDSETLIPLYKGGFKKLKDLTKQDVLISTSSEMSEILNENSCIEETSYEITFKNNLKVICSANHTWFNSCPRAHYKNKINSTQELYDKLQNNRFIFSVPILQQPVQYKQKNLIIPSYVKGLWLGDGSKHSGNLTASVEDSLSYSEILRSYGLKTKIRQYRENTCDITILNKNNERVIPYNIPVKHVPEEYIYSSVEQRQDFLKGLLDTDGCAEEIGTVLYNTNYDIFESASIIARSLGYKTFSSKKIAKYKLPSGTYKICKDCYILRIVSKVDLFNLPRKKQSIRDKYLKYSSKILDYNHIKSIRKLQTKKEIIKLVTTEPILITKDYIPLGDRKI